MFIPRQAQKSGMWRRDFFAWHSRGDRSLLRKVSEVERESQVEKDQVKNRFLSLFGYKISMFLLMTLCFISRAHGVEVQKPAHPKNILIGLSGSISCYKVAPLISQLKREGYEVKTMATSGAMQFLGSSTLEGLTGHKVERDTFEEGSQMQHIALARWADVLLLCPATGDLISGIATGRADNLVKSVCLAYDFQKKPFLIAPAMNNVMLHNPITQANIRKLSDMGVHVLPTEIGELACGDHADGRLLNPKAIALYIKYAYLLQNKDKRKILITSGGTSEDIDGVREVTNFSKGGTGAFFADFLTVAGHAITLVRAKSAATPTVPCKERVFTSSKDLDEILQEELGETHYDAVIQLAAVSDYLVDHLVVDGSPVAVGNGPTKKLSSDKSLGIVFKKNKKIIDEIKRYSLNPDLKLIGFKLTHNMTTEEVQRKIQKIFANAQADFVVHNELSEITATSHPAKIYDRAGSELREVSNKEEMAWALHQVISGS